MRRSVVALLLLLGTPACLAAQSDAPIPTARTATPVFRAGQWAARFEFGGSYSGPTYYGVGALRFTSARSAWTLSAGSIGSQVESQASGLAYHQDLERLQGAIGRRWYRPGHSRVRPFGEVGVTGLFVRGHRKILSVTQTTRGYGGGIYGSLGAAVFLAPALSLGASWSAGVDVLHQVNYLDDALVGKQNSFALGAGTIHLDGAFYF
jgi:hypothetical protein